MAGVTVVFYAVPLFIYALLPTDAAIEHFAFGDTTLGALGQLFTFGLFAIGLLVLVRRVHGINFWSLIGPAGAVLYDLRRTAYAVMLLMFLLEFATPRIDFADIAIVRPLGQWLLLLPVALLAILIQSGTEELFFRGYLQQQFGRLSSSRLIWLVLPSVLFGAGHYFSGYGPADGILYVIWATLLGLSCADLTARTGNIGAAVGLHLTNNAFAMLLVSMQDLQSSGLALILFPYDDPLQYDYSLASLFTLGGLFELAFLTLSVAVIWLTARIAIRR